MVIYNGTSFFLCFFLIFSYFISHSSLGSSEIEWFDTKFKKPFRINLLTKKLEFQIFKNTWEVQCDLEFHQIDLKDFPNSAASNVFDYQGKKLITIPGTGQVYSLDLEKKIFQRLDETFYRGCNFFALQYISKDTLFSLGGQGFWTNNHLLTYYDLATNEWELVKTSGKHPQGVWEHNGGVIFAKNKLYCLENENYLGHFKERYIPFFELDLTSKVWKLLGKIDVKQIKEVGVINLNLVSLGEIFLFLDPQNGLFFDPFLNELKKYSGTKKLFFMDQKKIWANDGWIYSAQINKNKSEKAILIDSISFADLQKNSIKIGAFYQESSIIDHVQQNSILIISAFLFLSLMGNFIFLRRRNIVADDSLNLNKLPESFEIFVAHFQENGLKSFLTTNELSEMIGCSNRSFDAQRQYRSNFIHSFNQYCLDTFGVKDAIFRINMDVDRRFYRYGLKEEALDEMIKMLNRKK